MKYYNEADAEVVGSTDDRVGKIDIKKTITGVPKCQEGFISSDKVTITNDLLEPTRNVHINNIGEREYIEALGIPTKDAIVKRPCFNMAGVVGLKVKGGEYPEHTQLMELPSDIESNFTIPGDHKIISFTMTILNPGEYKIVSDYQVLDLSISGTKLKVRGKVSQTLELRREYFVSVIFSRGLYRSLYHTQDEDFILIMLGDTIVEVAGQTQPYSSAYTIEHHENVKLGNIQIATFTAGDDLVPGKYTNPYSDPYMRYNRESTIRNVYEAGKAIFNYARNTLIDFKEGCNR
ncbi:MAG: hypothetical protein DRN17_04835 [Thermoplasmata archaeon]|nr:MAG: hypothetical protein DRN17_04835 [Thermoplasmata archaeon]